MVTELKANRAYLCDAAQAAALAKLLITPDFRVNPQCVGQPPTKIAEMAGFSVPPDTSILVVRLEGMGKEHPLSAEKLSPVLSLYRVKDFEAGMKLCDSLLHFGGLGHTCVIYSQDDAKIREFGLRMPAMRVLVNTPAPQGSTGITTNVFPSMTLGCGAVAGNVTSDNIGPLHLINLKRVAWHVREAEQAFESPEGKAYFASERRGEEAERRRGEEAKRGTGEEAKRWRGEQAQPRPGIADAVERYLASRGLPATAPPPPPAPTPAVIPSPAAEVVDRFLASRRGSSVASSPVRLSASSPPPVASSPPAPVACSPLPLPASSPGAATSPAPPAPPVEVVPFVCEADVRQAMREGRKIYIASKTIVTPAARDLGADILVKVD